MMRKSRTDGPGPRGNCSRVAGQGERLPLPSHYVEEDIDELKETHKQICAVLADAEEMRIWRESVKLWLGKLRALASEAEDLIEEFAYEFRRADAEEGKVRSSIGSVSSILDMVKGIQSIKMRFCSIKMEMKGLNLEGDRACESSSVRRKATGFLLPEPHVYGREHDKDKVVDSLVSSASMEDGVPVIAILGMGGVGKTTLAQLLYSDPMVCAHFKIKGWVHVSQDYDVTKLALAIMQCFTGRSCPFTELSLLQAKLIDAVKDTTFLLVLDDLWTMNKDFSDGVLSPLKYGALGSKVLITTRDECVARKMNLTLVHRLGHLSQDDCWRLFQWHAFGGEVKAIQFQSNVVASIKTKVVQKCKGLPLAARTLGGLLRFEHDENKWTQVLETDLLESDKNEDNGILEILKLSYIHLPAHLKRCFACYSVFPKGHGVSKKELIYTWVAYGLIQNQNGRFAFDIGLTYINDLLFRSLFQISKSGTKVTICMHDLIYDLSQNIFGEEHAEIKWSRIDPKNPILACTAHEPRRVRGFFEHIRLTREMLECIFFSLKNLRALSIRESNIKELPDSIGNLKHLRYLDLYGCSRLVSLPESICRLYNLQILDCNSSLWELPRNIHNLSNLQALILRKYRIPTLPSGIGRLTRLEELSYFVMGKDKERYAGIEEIKDLVNLRGNLYISDLHDVANLEDAEAACLKDKAHLNGLVLRWREKHSGDLEAKSMQVLQALQPHVNLAKLKIYNYCGPKFPSWLGHPSFVKLSTLMLFNCNNIQDLPPLGQLPCLKILHVHSSKSVKHVGSEFYSFNEHRCSNNAYSNRGIRDSEQYFLSLNTLTFCFMPKLEKWESYHCQFACLHELVIYGCPQLSMIPCAFPSLTKLELCNCPKLIAFPTVPLLHWLTLSGEWDERLLLSELATVKVLKLSSNKKTKTIALYKYRLPLVEDLIICKFPQLKHIYFWAPSHIPECSSQLSTSLPDNLAFSIKSMSIEYCHNLNFSSKVKLPPTLEELKIKGCPRLQQWCHVYTETKLGHVRIQYLPKPLQIVLQWITGLEKKSEFIHTCKRAEREEVPLVANQTLGSFYQFPETTRVDLTSADKEAIPLLSSQLPLTALSAPQFSTNGSQLFLTASTQLVPEEGHWGSQIKP